MLKLQPVLVLLAGAAIAVAALYAGLPLEIAALDAAGQQWLPWMDDGVGLIAAFGLMIVGALMAGLVTRTRPLTLGRQAGRNAVLGLALGIILVAIGSAASLATGNGMIVSLPRTADVATVAMLGGTLIFLLNATAEEVLFRGWVQPMVARNWGTPVAIVVGGIVFAALHNLQGLFVLPFAVSNLLEGANSWLVNVNLFLGGVVFGMLYRVTGGIAAPVMFHFGWNWADAILFGLTPNPGKLSFGSIFDIDVAGPAQLGGIEEGLMASIFATLLLILIAASFAWLWRAGWHETPAAEKESIPPGRKTDPTAKTLPPVTLTEPELPTSAPAPAAVVADIEPDPATIFMPGSDTSATTQLDYDKDRTMLMLDGDMPPPLAPLEPASAGPVSRVQSATHEGCVRKVNEDRFLVDEAGQIYVVADGMGGHKFGDRASTMIVEHVRDTKPAAGLDARLADVETAILTANQNIYAEAQTNGSRMGSTVVALMIDASDYAILWAGDSRAYRWRGGNTERLTKDHTQVQEMVDKGLLAPEDVARHPMSHVLVRAVGVNQDFKLDTVRGKIEAGDVYFLCSDGIYDVLDEDEIGALLAKAAVANAMDTMIKMSLDLGARDNVTGIIVMPDVTA